MALLTPLWFMLFLEKSFFWTPNTLLYHVFNLKGVVLLTMKLYKLQKTMFPNGSIGRIKAKAGPLCIEAIRARLFAQGQCGYLLKWRRARNCVHGKMAGYEDVMGNTFASLFLFLLSNPRKTSDCLKFSGFPLSMSHIGVKMQDRPFPGYGCHHSILSLRFFPGVLRDKG